jgi:hypothetical protein
MTKKVNSFFFAQGGLDNRQSFSRDLLRALRCVTADTPLIPFALRLGSRCAACAARPGPDSVAIPFALRLVFGAFFYQVFRRKN